MKKRLLLIIGFLLLLPLVFATQSTDPTDYYYDGTYYLTDGLPSGDITLDAGTATNGQNLNTGGWTHASGTPTYSSGQAKYGSVSMYFDNTAGISAYYQGDGNTSFYGKIVYSVYCTTSWSDCGHTFYNYIDNSSTRHGWDGGIRAKYKLETATTCSVTPSVGNWYNLTLDYSTPNELYWYVNDVLCKSKNITNENILGKLQFLDGGASTVYYDNFFITNGVTTPVEGAGGGGSPADTVTFITPPTPADAGKNNTQVSIKWNSTTNRSDFYFGTTNPPTVKYFANVTNSTNLYTWITNVTADDTYYYYASLPSNTSINSTVRSWIYDTTEPPITIQSNSSFTSLNVTKNIYNNSFLLSYGITDDVDLFATHVNVTFSNGTSYLAYTNSTLSGTSWTYSSVTDVSGWPSGNYTINILASDSHTANKIGDYKPKKITNGLDFVSDEGINVMFWAQDSAVMNASKCEEDRYCFDVNFTDGQEKKRTFFVQANATLYYKGDDSGYLGHFVISNDGLSGNWLDVEGVNTTATVTQLNSSMYSIELAKIKDKVRFHSIGGLNVNHKVFAWQRSQLSLLTPVLNPTTPIEVLDLSGQCRATEDSGKGIFFDYRFYRNSTLNYTGTTTNTTNGTLYTVYTIPSSILEVGQEWIVSCRANAYGNQTAWINSSAGVVSGYSLDDCSTGNTTSATFKIFEENTPSTYLTGTMEIDGTYWPNAGNQSNIRTFNVTYPSASSFNVCITPSTGTLYSNMYIKYDVPTGFTQRWFIRNFTFSNTTQTILMGNYNSTSGISDMKITTRYVSDYAYFPNVIGKLQRRYAGEAVWRTVQQDLSGDFGLLFYNIREEDTDYRLIYTDLDNNILKTTNSMKFVCTSGVCELTQQLSPYSASTTTINPTLSYTFNNATKILNLTFNEPSGTTVNIRQIVTKETLSGTAQICDQNVSASSGYLVCNVTGYTGTLALSVLSDTYADLYTTFDVKERSLADQINMQQGSFWSFGLVLTAGMFGAILGPVGAIIGVIFALVVLMFMKILTAITLAFVLVAAIIGAAIGVKLRQ